MSFAKKNLLTRVATIAAGLTLPAIAGAGTVSITPAGTNAVTSGAVDIRLDANMTGIIKFVMAQRTGSGLTGTTAAFWSGTNSAATTIDFGTVSANPPAFTVGTGTDLSDGAIYVAQAHAELFYTGYNNATVAVTEAAAAAPPAGIRVSANATNGNYDYRWFCGTNAGAGIRDDGNVATNDPALTIWSTAAAYNSAAGNALNTTGANCFTGATVDAGTSIGTDVDLAMFFGDSAPTGSCSATYRFTVTLTS